MDGVVPTVRQCGGQSGRLGHTGQLGLSVGGRETWGDGDPADGDVPLYGALQWLAVAFINQLFRRKH